jgi:hypothetical protein
MLFSNFFSQDSFMFLGARHGFELAEQLGRSPFPSSDLTVNRTHTFASLRAKPGGRHVTRTQIPATSDTCDDWLPLRRLASNLARRLDEEPAFLGRDEIGERLLSDAAAERTFEVWIVVRRSLTQIRSEHLNPIRPPGLLF